MLISKIELNNFRQFKGNQTIDFSTSPERNITLILGDNTSGKTTLLQSVLWCFYEKAHFKTREELLNKLVAREMNEVNNEKTVSVTVSIIHKNYEYTIQREQAFIFSNNEVKQERGSRLTISYKDKDGQTEFIPERNVRDTVNDILPEDLSSYFLYDTERFGNITDKKDVTDAVKGLLGLTVLENTLEHIGRETRKDTVLGKFSSNLNLGNEKKSKNALVDAQRAEENKEQLENRLKKVNEQIEYYEERKEELQGILRNMKSVSELQKEKEKFERNLNIVSNDLENDKKLFFRNFNRNLYSFFSLPLIKKAKLKLVDADVSDRGIKDMNANSIKHIFERGVCVCGTRIKGNKIAHEHLQKELEYLPPKSVGLLINDFQSRLDAYKTLGETYYEQLNQSYRNILSNKKRVSDLNEEIEVLSKEIERNRESASYELELKDVNQKLMGFIQTRDQIIANIAVEEHKIKSKKEEYEQSIAESKKNKEIKLYMAYAKEIYNWVEKTYKKREKDIKNELEEKVNEYFSKIYHGQRKVEINDKYRVKLITLENDEELITDESQGLETVKNFSFLAGIVDLAKNKLKDSKNDTELEIESEAFPLILDAPFSNADERHVSSISKVLPEVAEQLILIVMRKDWNYAEKEMSNKVGKKYYLDKQSEVYTIIKEEVV